MTIIIIIIKIRYSRPLRTTLIQIDSSHYWYPTYQLNRKLKRKLKTRINQNLIQSKLILCKASLIRIDGSSDQEWNAHILILIKDIENIR